MDKKVMQRWVKALRSGKYKQNTGVLKTENGYCCLGVLCELAQKSKVVDDFDGSDGIPPESVREWAGLKSALGNFVRDEAKFIPKAVKQTSNDINHAYSLAALNDSGASFKGIARFIENNYKEL